MLAPRLSLERFAGEPTRSPVRVIASVSHARIWSYSGDPRGTSNVLTTFPYQTTLELAGVTQAFAAVIVPQQAKPINIAFLIFIKRSPCPMVECRPEASP